MYSRGYLSCNIMGRALLCGSNVTFLLRSETRFNDLYREQPYGIVRYVTARSIRRSSQLRFEAYSCKELDFRSDDRDRAERPTEYRVISSIRYRQ